MTDSLPNRMDAAAQTLEEVTVRYHNPSMDKDPKFQHWNPVTLRSVAAMWRAEDEARGKLESDLAEVIGTSGMGPHGTARRILEHFDVTPKLAHNDPPDMGL